MPHQGGQLTEDTEVGGEKEKGTERQVRRTEQDRCLERHQKEKVKLIKETEQREDEK